MGKDQKISINVRVSFESIGLLLDLVNALNRIDNEFMRPGEKWTADETIEYAIDQLWEQYEKEINAAQTTDPQP